MKKCKPIINSALAISLVMTATTVPVYAAAVPSIDPVKAAYGYYVDNYKNNEPVNMTPETNPSIGVLSEMLDYFTPGTSWDNGTILNESMHKLNMERTASIANNASKAEQDAAYLDDRRNQGYSMVSGLGVYADEFIRGTNAGTTIPDEVPSDASTVKYTDWGNQADSNDNEHWADTDTKYGSIIELINIVRGHGASTSQAKKYYKYMRPFRWSRLSSDYPQVNIISSLQPCEKSDPSNDGGYNSGHTNAAYLTSISMAYAVPEQYQQLLLRASELGNNRIVAGMHSCLDVIGGRMTSTAIAAANLYDSANSDAKTAAINAGKELTSTADSEYTYEQYQQDKAVYLERLTYGMLSGNDTTKEMLVPKGAEVLLESRLPYLSDVQRRYVLYSTGIPSGYSILDDAEGWGRINLFEAAAGYGSFDTDITVTMDASKGGFNASDNWMNDIDGTGSLTKEGTGTLSLSGNNTYSGATTINGGTLIANSSNSFGDGNVTNNSTIIENTNSTVNFTSYNQSKNATLELNVSNENDIISINKDAVLGGTLILNFTDGYVPSKNSDIIKAANISSKFDNVVINGLSEYNGIIKYTDNSVVIADVNESSDKLNSNASNISNTSDKGNTITNTTTNADANIISTSTNTLDNNHDTAITTLSNTDNKTTNNSNTSSVSSDKNSNSVKTGDTYPVIPLLISLIGAALTGIYLSAKNKLSATHKTNK